MLLDIIVLEKVTILGAVQIFRRLTEGGHIKHPKLLYLQANKIKIHSRPVDLSILHLHKKTNFGAVNGVKAEI